MNDKPLNNRKKIGLALGGGGWRGIAHIGVLKVLEKNGIPIDFISGTSAGALIGGLYSYFGNATDLENFILNFGYRDLFSAISDPRLKSGIFKGDKFIRYVNHLTNNADIKDLKIPFSAVATNLITGKAVYLKEGNMAEAIRSSISIPLVFQPTFRDEMYLVDGGLTENIPIRCVKDMGADIVIAVNLNSNLFPMRESDIKSSSSIALVTTRITLDGLASFLSKEADILIEPKIQRQDIKISFSYFFKFVKEKEIIKTGEEETEKFISDIKRLAGL